MPTLEEQFADALQREALSRPLSSGGVFPADVHPSGPPVVPPVVSEEIVGVMEPDELHPWTDTEGEATTHISFRVFSPFVETESVDIGMMFPLDPQCGVYATTAARGLWHHPCGPGLGRTLRPKGPAHRRLRRQHGHLRCLQEGPRAQA